ncbi:FtsB family cell division protein [Leptotrichia sp. HSP-536]|uniref:Septum formation initiator family protein n=1 Tax=Leptotrichia alba TaxID=3239304 RepID=A0AB39V1D2_9FUSO
MKKIYFIGNIIFFCLVVYFIGQSLSVYMGKKKMKISLMETEKNIKELIERKNKLLEEKENTNDKEKTEKYARNDLNLKREGESTYKIVE